MLKTSEHKTLLCCRSFCGVSMSSCALGFSSLVPPGWMVFSGTPKPARFFPREPRAVLSGRASLANRRTQNHLALRARPLRLIYLILLFLCPAGCVAEAGPHRKPECTKENPHSGKVRLGLVRQKLNSGFHVGIWARQKISRILG